jgi:hypothetical protein
MRNDGEVIWPKSTASRVSPSSWGFFHENVAHSLMDNDLRKAFQLLNQF